jgi:hypothetical protein
VVEGLTRRWDWTMSARGKTVWALVPLGEG